MPLTFKCILDPKNVIVVRVYSPFVQVHGMSDGVVSLQRDNSQSKNTELGRENSKEPRHLASGRVLPVNGHLTELPKARGVHDGQEAEVEAHAEVGHGQVAYQEPECQSHRINIFTSVTNYILVVKLK